jgi:DNA-binding response OmpR family regulator
MRILLVEDDVKIASFIIKGLKQSNFAVDHATEGKEGILLAQSVSYDVGIIDIMLPGDLDGLNLIEELRKKNIDTPLIILSAKRSLEDRIKGLETGSDDYLVKPFSFAELLARIQALIRRSTRKSQPLNYLQVGDLYLDYYQRKVFRAGVEIDLQNKEFTLLEYLMHNSGRVMSKTMIMEHVWDYSFDPQTNIVDVLVHRLRNKVDKDFSKKMIQTIRGVGYVLKEV